MDLTFRALEWRLLLVEDLLATTSNIIQRHLFDRKWDELDPDLSKRIAIDIYRPRRDLLAVSLSLSSTTLDKSLTLTQ